jgi:hypothetical protein
MSASPQAASARPTSRRRGRRARRWPVALLDEYPFDAAHVAEYARLAKTEAGFREYLDRFVLTQHAAAAE